MSPKIVRRMVAVLLAVSAIPAQAQAAAVPERLPAMPWSFLAMLALAGTGAILATHLWLGDSSQRRRDRLQRQWLDGLGMPAAVSAVDGTVLWANREAASRGNARARSVCDLLSEFARIDAAAIYRTATAARRCGFAAEPVPGTDSGTRLLAARLDAPDQLVWSLAPAEPSLAPSASVPALAPPEAPEALDRCVLETVPVALMRLDLGGRLLWQNHLAGEMIGQDIRPGTALADLVISLGRPLSALFAEAVSSGRGRREMLRLRGEGEHFFQISVSHMPGPDGGSLIAVLSDASELRQLEDKFVQSQKMEAIGQLAGGVAHDFNNVLTAISGHSDLLLLGKDALHPDYSDLIQIRQNTHRAAALVRQLLAFSRKQTLNPVLLSVQDVVSDTQYLLNRLIGERVTLAVEIERHENLGSVRADRQQLEQALMNLVVNARDAMPEGGTVSIAAARRYLAESSARASFEVPAGSYVEISVCDEGTGIDQHIIDRVFDPFFTTKPQGEGTGLGLSTVYGIVKQSGGYIFAENRARGGACFRILLPRVDPAAVEAPARDPARVEQRDLTGQGAILLVEDEDPVRAFASRALRLRGYEVMEAASAEDAIGLIDDSENRIDLLVSDVVMPGTDGPTLAVRAREKRPGLRVIFISGYAEDSFRRNLMDHDFMFLAKPFSLVELTAKVKEALGSPADPSRH